MRSVICVLKSGGIYDPSWVEKLQRGVKKHLPLQHRFVCLSDVDVPCERIHLSHEWPGWWAKLELFKPGIIDGPTVYLDLDTAVTGDISGLFSLPYNFAMLQNFSNPEMVGSGVMWFKREAPSQVYTKFCKQPEAYIKHHERVAQGSFLGDQAFIWDTLGRNVDLLTDEFKGIVSYKRSCRSWLPPGTKLVVFPGSPKPTELTDDWLLEAWQ